MKKGFTLIELLAVIVILAIIALIATPIVLNIINDSKENAVLRSADFYLKGIEIAKASAKLKGISVSDGTYQVMQDGNICIGMLNNTCTGDILKVEFDGEVPNNGTITFEEGKIKDIALKYSNDKTIIKNDEEDLIIITPKSFREDSWDTIAANVRAGNLSKYKVGDTKEITLTSTDTDIAGTYTVRIANTSTSSECKTEVFSQTACGFVVEFVDIISKYNMNSTDTSVGGWEASKMRKYVNNDIYIALPEELRNNIINTYVVSGHEYRKTENYKTTDKIYLLSTKEVYGKEGTKKVITVDSAELETRQLDYYSNLGVTTDSYSEAIKKLNGSAISWRLRSALSDGTRTFYSVLDSGVWSFHAASDTLGVAVAFRIG